MIIDTSVLFAAIDSRDPAHAAAGAVIATPEPRLVPEPVVVEADWLIADRFGPEIELRFLRGLDEGKLVVEQVLAEDRLRAAGLIDQYRDLDLGYVDATIIAIAERLGESRIATLDRRHFSVVRPRHVTAFELLP